MRFPTSDWNLTLLGFFQTFSLSSHSFLIISCAFCFFFYRDSCSLPNVDYFLSHTCDNTLYRNPVLFNTRHLHLFQPYQYDSSSDVCPSTVGS